MDRESLEMKSWWVGEQEKSPSLGLILCPPVDLVKHGQHQTNTDITVIPGRLTSILQPLDISFKKPFKDQLRERWTTWMVEGQKRFTAAGNMRAASLATVSSWVLGAWQVIPEEIVVGSFKKCGISNSLDGTEDDILWEEEALTTPGEESVAEEEEDLICIQW